MTDSMRIEGVCDCLGRTCLKWRPDGELTALDFSLVMQRLALVDPEVTALQELLSAPEPWASFAGSAQGSNVPRWGEPMSRPRP